MLSYQHAYHAGGPADLHKHAVLAAILARLTAKDRPLSYVETHAGRGLYDIAGPEARKTGEAERGILRLLASGRLPVDHPYRTVIETVRTQHGRDAYPGSPLIAMHLLRPQDQLHLMELHPQEHAALKTSVKGANVHIHRRDGLEGVLAIAPPRPRAGLVLVDPSYEVKAEYDAVVRFVPRLHRKWPEATILVWYPLLPAGHHRAMGAALDRARLPKRCRQEIPFPHPPRDGMQGSGMIAVNLPFGAEPTLDAVRDLLA